MSQHTAIVSPDVHVVSALPRARTAVLAQHDRVIVLADTRGRTVNVAAGGRGLEGDKGEPGRNGDDGTLGYAAAQALSALSAVWITADGLRYASAADGASCDAVLGITTHASLAGEANLVRHFGRISDASWAWTQGDPVFLGRDGLLTQTPDDALPLVELGIALDAQTLLVRIQTAFF